jgi:hypothetical protein
MSTLAQTWQERRSGTEGLILPQPSTVVAGAGLRMTSLPGSRRDHNRLAIDGSCAVSRREIETGC